MRNFAKWLLIIWSLLCLIGVYFGFNEFSGPSEKVVSGIGGEELEINVIVAIFAGLLLYLIIAMPALLIWLLLDRREDQVVDHLRYYDLESRAQIEQPCLRRSVGVIKRASREARKMFSCIWLYYDEIDDHSLGTRLMRIARSHTR